MILKIFSPTKFGENIGVFLLKLLLVSVKNLTITLVFEGNINFVAKNGQKSQKIAIIKSTPGFSCLNNL
jgi:hypothetical protein